MKEEILKQFFLGQVQATEIEKDIYGSVKQLSPIRSKVQIEDMADAFQISRAHVVALCDGVIGGRLPREMLMPIGFALMASDAFEWEDDLISEVIADWSCPEVNYPLNLANIRRCKRRLTNIESLPKRVSVDSRSEQGRLISVRLKAAMKS